MQADEDMAVADCGCTLYREGDGCIDPYYIQCPLHAATKNLLALVRSYVTTYPLDDYADHAHELIARATGKEPR